MKGTHPGNVLRLLATLAWWVGTLAWLHWDPVFPPMPIALSMGLLVCGASVWRWLEGDDIPRTVGHAGMGMIVLPSLYPLLNAVLESGVPVILLAAGWLCFIGGTWYALHRTPEHGPAENAIQTVASPQG